MKKASWHRSSRFAGGAFLLLFALSGIGRATIPPALNFQGYLTSPSGNPIQGSVSMVFKLYGQETGGTVLWTETHPTVQVINGIYSVLLGETTPLGLPFDGPYYLGIQVGSDPEMTPRIALTSTGYAFRAHMVETVTAAQAGAVALNQPNSITSGMIADGTITNADIASGAAIDVSKLSGVAAATHNHDASYVNVTGDTMTGSLTLPLNGLVAGTNQLVLAGGNVGMGTTSPTQKLEVSGNVKITGTGNGLAFSDGTTQTTAVTGGGGGVPSGFVILGGTSTSPSGYTYTGKVIGLPGSWAAKANMPTGRHAPGVAVVNGRIYVVGGYTTGSTAVATNEEYDPATNTWATKTPMPTARVALVAVAVNNKIYAIGGYGTTGAVASTEEYDPATNAWTTKTSMSAARWEMTAAAANNKIYVLGGQNGSTPLATNEEYDPATNTWATRAPMPTAKTYAAAAAVNGKIYAIGGSIGGTIGSNVVATNEEYDPAANTWTAKTGMHTAREAAAIAVANNRIYVMGGVAGSTVIKTNEEYDPAADAWADRAGMRTPRSWAEGATVNNKVYVIGGSGWPGVTFLSTNEEFTPEHLYGHQKN